MAKHFLADEMTGERGFKAEPWYNKYGDCVVFKSEDVGVVAERIDDILTLYYSIEGRRPVGFQLKGVKHLMQRHGCNTVAVTGAATENEIKISLLLMIAYDAGPRNIQRRLGYANAHEVVYPSQKPAISVDAVPVS